MVLIGQKIKAIKDIENMIKAGEIFTITDITPDGALRFKGGGVHKGLMNFRELSECFESYVEPKYVWSDWNSKNFLYYFEDDLELIPYTYRYNGKRVQMRVFYRGRLITTQSACHKDDTFNLNSGLLLCKARMIAKMTAIDADEMRLSL